MSLSFSAMGSGGGELPSLFLLLICTTCKGLLGASALGLGAFGLFGFGLPDPAIFGPLWWSAHQSDRLRGLNRSVCDDSFF